MENEQFFSSKHVVITGSAGFIGSNLCDKLLSLGAKVTGIDNFLTGKRENLAEAEKNPNFTLVEADINDANTFRNVLSEARTKYGPVGVALHFASPASPPRYQEHPRETYLVNTWALHNFLEWLRENDPDVNFLYAGTSEAYGNPLEHPQVEEYWGNVNPNGIRSCYDEAKRLGETICGVFEREYDMDVKIIRIFNTYGPRMDLNDGRILPQFLSEVKAGKPLTVYGDGTQTRSYCYIDDLVAGILAFVNCEMCLSGETFNLGNPGEFTVLETAKIVNEVCGRDPEMIEYQPLPKDDPLRRQPDITKAKRYLHWEPKVAFREGLTKMLQYYGIIE